MVENEDGFCDWQMPLMKGYKMACCDCGLIHTMEFKIYEMTKPDKLGFQKKIKKLGKYFRVHMRASRDVRATAAMRRKKK